MVDLYDLLHNIQKRPAMYLGEPSISHLRAFLAGYFFARHLFTLFTEFAKIDQNYNGSPSPNSAVQLLIL